MRNAVASVLQGLGAAAVVGGGFLVSIPVGLIVVGLGCLAVGVLVDR